MRTLATLLLRAGAGALVAAPAWWFAGPAGLAATSVVFGVLLAKPLLELIGESGRWLRERAYADIEGRHYAFRGTPVQVVEDEAHVRWVRLADLQAVLGPGASEGALSRLYGEGLQRLGVRRQAHLSAEVLWRHLAKDTRPEAIRFRLWVEREILKPSQVLQQRAGAPAPVPRAVDAPDDPAPQPAPPPSPLSTAGTPGPP